MARNQDETTAYAKAVLDSNVLACRLVRLACERHLSDLEEGPKRGLRFDAERAKRVFDFFSFMKLAEGGFEDKPFVLLPFQKFIVGSIFGWIGSDGHRRFRTAYVEIGKGNGKSPLAGGIGLFGLVADDEAAAEIYSAATTREQAGILFRDAKNIAGKSEALSKRLEIGEHNIAFAARSSFFRPVSSEHRGLDGKRPHMALIDEIHEHPNALVVDKMRAGTKSRRQALIFEITNSGYDRESVCWQHHQYSQAILEERSEDDSWFAFVCGLDPCKACRADGQIQPKDGCKKCDDWRNESVWLKANPGLGEIIQPKYLQEQVREAVGMPAKENIVKRLNFCIWTESEIRWLPMEKWDACGEPFGIEDLKDKPCYVGLDLASTLDISAASFVFPQDDGCQKVLAFFWVPEEAATRRERTNKTRFGNWIKAGLIETTPGDATDYDRIRQRINELRELYDIQEIGVDPWNAVQLATQLEGDGFKIKQVRQGYGSLSAPSKEMERLVVERKLQHGGNPVLRWMAGNVTVETDASGNIKPSKAKSTEKIDGIVATINALAVASVAGEDNWYSAGVLRN